MSKLPRLLPLIAVAIGGVVAVRAIGAGPDLFQGARAWAAETTTATAAATGGSELPPAVCALSPEQLAQQAGISPAELRIIQSLSARRGELDLREEDLATQLPLMLAAEQKLDDKIRELNAIKAEVEALLGQADSREQAEINRLVEVYQAMRPRDAAPVLASLDDEVRLPVAAAMRPRSLAAILAQMPPAAAQELTEKLARRYEGENLAARAARASADEPAASPARTAAAAAPPPAATPAASPPASQRPRARPAASRPAATPPARRPAAETPADAAPSGPRPYQADAEAGAADAPAADPARSPPAQPRQSVQ